MIRKFIIIFTILISSCVFSRIDDSIDLGNNYRYIQDAPQTIIYHRNEDYQGTGVEIVPPIVLSYKFNNRYIISKSQEVDENTGRMEKNPIHYWIIDKSNPGVPVIPMDSASFYQKLKDLNIGLSL